MSRKNSYLIAMCTLIVLPLVLFQNCGEGFVAEGNFDLSSIVDPVDPLNNNTNYEIKNNKVYYGNTVIKNADINSFESVQGHFANDINNHYFGATVIPRSDAVNVSVINGYFAEVNGRVFSFKSGALLDIKKSDMNNLNGPKFTNKGQSYFLSHRLAEDVDLESYDYAEGDKYFTGFVTRDKNRAYVYQGVFGTDNIENPSGLKIISHSTFYTDGLNIYDTYGGKVNSDGRQSESLGQELLSDEDNYYLGAKTIKKEGQSYQVLSRYFYQIGSAIYNKNGVKIADYSPGDETVARGYFLVHQGYLYSSTSTESKKLQNYSFLNDYFIKDGDKIYCDADSSNILGLSGIDYEVFDNSILVNDKLFYTSCRNGQEVDKASFQRNIYGYLHDKNHVYFNSGTKVETTHGQGFKRLFNSYYTDGNKIYLYGNSNFKSIDYDPSIEFISSNIFKSNGVYYYFDRQEISEISSGDVKFLDKNYWMANGKAYYNNKEIESFDLNNLKVTNHVPVGGVLLNDDQAYLYDGTVFDVDVSTFKMLSFSHFKDKNSVYYIDKVIEGADPDSFKVVNSYQDGGDAFSKALSLYGVDKSYMYNGSERLVGVDINNFRFLDSFLISKDQIYKGDKLIEGIDVNSFAKLEGTNKYIDKDNVYNSRGEVVANADPQDYKEYQGGSRTSNAYFSSGGKLYYLGEEVVGADVNSFKVSTFSNIYAFDKKNVYRSGKQFFEYEGSNIQVLNYNIFFTDSAVYYTNKIIEGADPKTIAEVGGLHSRFSKDKDHVYYNNNIVEGAQPNSITVVGESGSSTFAKDNSNVYFGVSKVVGANVATFKQWSSSHYAYGYDDQFMYYQAAKMEGVDIDSFEILGLTYSRDKNTIYSINSKIVGVDPDSFEILEYKENSKSYYSRDKSNVYYYGYALVKADRDTFVALDNNRAEDKNYTYSGVTETEK